jgi:LacI family transcriptional regulator
MLDSMKSSPSRKRKARPTIQLVATQAGVAAATVSGILGHRPDCYASEETRQRVFRAARQLGYRPSPMIRARHGKATATVGIITGAIDVVEPTIRMISAFERAATTRNCMAIIACHQNRPEMEDQAIRWLLDRYVDGIVIYRAETGPHDELRRLVDEGFPVVTLDGAGILDFQSDDVTVNHYQIGRLQAQHLLATGRKRIGLVNSLERCFVNDEKIRGVEEALAEAGVPLVARMDLSLAAHSGVRHWDTSEFDQIYEFLKRRASELDALASVGDLLALATMSRAIQLGINIPQDLAVIGSGGIIAGEQFVPALSTVVHSPERMGELSFQILQERMNGKRKPHEFRRETISPSLVARASTGA